MNVDIHSHLYHPSWYPKAFQKNIAIQYVKKKTVQAEQYEKEMHKINRLLSDETGEKTISIMDKIGIDKKIIAIIDLGLELGEPELSITEIHKKILGICFKHPDRLIGFAGVDPRRPNADRIIKFAFEELGAKGLKLHPTSIDWSLFDQITLKLVSITEKYGFPVLIHTGETIDILSSKNCSPEKIVKFALRNENAVFIAAHSAFSLWPKFLEYDPLPKNLYFDISGWQGRLRTDSENLRHDVKDILLALKGKIFFGSDNPFFSYNIPMLEMEWIRFIRNCALEIDDETEQAIFNPGIIKG